MKRLFLFFLLLLMVIPLAAQDDDDADKQRAIEIAAQDDTFAGWLTAYPDWTADGWRDEDGIWYIEFYSEAADEWLGYARVHLETETVIEAFAPRPLSPAEYAEYEPRVRELIDADREIQTIMVHPELWDVGIEWYRWEQRWTAYLNWGLDSWLVTFWLDENTGDIHIDEIRDANALEAEQAERESRDQAVSLAYGADGIDRALDGYDNWITYVSPQGENRYVVNFVVDDAMLFSALVDIATGEVIDAE